MPGIIRVSVLEAVDLPEVITDGAVGKDVTAKVTLGPKLFKTQPGVADGGKIASWNSDFAFPVMNLRDKLVISICDSEDHSMTQTAIEIPSIIQKGSRDEFVALNKGGRIHLRMSFVLTEEERKKIETMRVAALKRKEEAERLKKTVVMLPVTPEKQQKKSPVSTVAITEVDVSTTGDKKESAKGSPDEMKDATITGDTTISADKTNATGDKTDSTVLSDKAMDSPAPGDKKTSTPKRASPKPMFNYAKAIGVPPSAKKGAKKPSAAVSDSSTNDLKTDNGVEQKGEDNKSESTKPDPSVETAAQVSSTTSGEAPRNAVSVTEAVDSSIAEDAVEVPRNAESATKPVDLTTAVEAVEAPRAAESVTKPGNITKPGEEDTSDKTRNQPFSWGDEFKASNSSDVQSGREAAGEAGNTDQAEIKPTGSVDQATSPPTKVESGAPETSEVRHSKLDSSSEDESSSLMIISEDHQVVRSSSSGPLTLRTVKARVKRTLSRVSSRRSSNSLTRSPAQVPVVWVQEVVRRAMSNVKGCYGFNPSYVHH